MNIWKIFFSMHCLNFVYIYKISHCVISMAYIHRLGTIYVCPMQRPGSKVYNTLRKYMDRLIWVISNAGMQSYLSQLLNKIEWGWLPPNGQLCIFKCVWSVYIYYITSHSSKLPPSLLIYFKIYLAIRLTHGSNI